jgi:peptidoglycan L-alanyl-D-glutamate endopeptidase CwlK
MSEYDMDQVSEDRLKEVHPLLAAKVRAMANELAAKGIIIRVTQGMRSWDEQDKLWQQGRTKPGPIVTMARPGFSYHNFGLAVDVVPMTPMGPDWDVSHPQWKKIVEVGISLGLESGAAWRTFKDYPHFQLTGNLPLTPTPQLRATFQTEGIIGVWKMTGYEAV